MNGWIKMHRKLKLWEWYSDHNTTRVFIHLLLSVNSKVGEHQGVEIPIGCVKTGRKELAKQTGLSEQQIRRSLNNLQKSQDITIKPTNKFSLITVVKWGEYQSSPEKATNKRADKQPTNAPENNHKQEEKNKRNKLYIDFLDQFNKATGKKFRVIGEKVCRQLNARLKEGFTLDEIIEAAGTCKADPYHIDNPKYLTPEFITRLDKLQKYAQGGNGDLFTPFTQTGQRIDGEPLCNGLTRQEFIDKFGRIS